MRLSEFSRIEITGEDEDSVRALARAMVCSAAATHSPQELQIAVVANPSAIEQWEWVKWLPHSHSRQQRDFVGFARMIAGSISELDALLPADLAERPRFGRVERGPLPHLLIVVDDQDIPPGNAVITTDGVLGVTVLELPARWDELAVPGRLRLALGRLDQVRALAPAATGVLLGIDEAALAPVQLDVVTEPHLYLFGDSASGKSAMLRGYAWEVMRRYTPAQAQIFALDYRRALLGEIPREYLTEYLTTPDDYELVSTSLGNPLLPLLPMLPQARDVGLHLVLTRRAGGAARSLYDPVIQALRDAAAPGILLTGSPDEGPLIGNARPAASPAGRGQLVTRADGLQVVQLAWTEPKL